MSGDTEGFNVKSNSREVHRASAAPAVAVPAASSSSSRISCSSSMNSRDLAHLQSLILESSGNTIGTIGGGDNEHRQETAPMADEEECQFSNAATAKRAKAITSETIDNTADRAKKPHLNNYFDPGDASLTSPPRRSNSRDMAFVTALVLDEGGDAFDYDDDTLGTMPAAEQLCLKADEKEDIAAIDQTSADEGNQTTWTCMTSNHNDTPTNCGAVSVNVNHYGNLDAASHGRVDAEPSNYATPVTVITDDQDITTNNGSDLAVIIADAIEPDGNTVAHEGQVQQQGTMEALPYAIVESDGITSTEIIEDATGLYVNSPYSKCKRHRWIVLAFLILFICGFGASLAIRNSPSFATNRDDRRSGSDVANREWDSEARLTEMRTAFEQVSSPLDFLNPLSAQSQALDWLVYKDTLLKSITDPNLFQRYVLLVLAFGNNGGAWRGIDPWDQFYGAHECDAFQGIDCNSDNEITHLDMHVRRVTGSIPDELGLLTSLTMMQFGNNDIVGTIPESLYKLTKLGESLCRILDPTPSPINICSTLVFCLSMLETFDLSINSISSTISTAIGKLTNLNYFASSRTLLTGPLPDSMKLLTSMSKFIFRLMYSIADSPKPLIAEYPTHVASLFSLLRTYQHTTFPAIWGYHRLDDALARNW